MGTIKTRSVQALVALLLAAIMAVSVAAALPGTARAEDGSLRAGESLAQDDAGRPSVYYIEADWVSGSRQPASGGMFAWYAVTDEPEYYNFDRFLYEDLVAEDFMLQVKTPGGEWTDVPGKNLVVIQDSELTAPFEAIIAALVPANEDTVYKKWRIVYLPNNVESDAITQGPKATIEESIVVSDYSSCSYYAVEQLPWSKEQYDVDNVPPIYVSYMNFGARTQLQISDPGFTKPNADAHVLYPLFSWGSMALPEEGRRFGSDYLEGMKSTMGLGSLEDEETSIADVVDYWDSMSVFPSTGFDAQALYDKLAPYALDPEGPEETAEAYFFWVSGAGTQERVDMGVTDYILVVISDYSKYGTERHVWNESPSWEWIGDEVGGFSAAAATFTCTVIDEHVKTIPAQVTRTFDSESNANVYTASVTLDGRDYFDTRQQVENGIDSNDLKTAIEEAETEIESTSISEDGKDLADGVEYVNQSERGRLLEAVSEARTVLSWEAATQLDIDATTLTLKEAVEVFRTAKKISSVDKAMAQKLIDEAVADLYTSDEADKFIPGDVKQALVDAITTAKKALASKNATQKDIDEAMSKLDEAKAAFDVARKNAQNQLEPSGGSQSDNPPAANPAKQMGADGTALGTGASVQAAEAAILSATSDEGPAGSRFAPVMLRSTKQGKNSVTLKWAKVSGAVGYTVYGAACGKANKMKRIGSTSKVSLKVSKIAGKKLAKGKYHKFMVVALDAKGNVVSSSKVVHVAAKGGKVGNVSKVTTKAKKGKVALKKGKAFKLGAKQVAKGSKVSNHRKISYETTNVAVATISKKGVVKAKGVGTCYVFAYAQNGVYAKVKVTVK